MFSSGFSETTEGSVPPGADRDRDSQSDVGDELTSEAGSFSSSKWTRHFEDSDDEDDEVFVDGIDHDIDEVQAEMTLESAPSSQTTMSSDIVSGADGSTIAASSTPTMIVSEDTATAGLDNELDDPNSNRNVRPKLSHPSSPRSRSSFVSVKHHEPGWHHVSKSDSTPGPSKLRVVVKDVAYTTYRGVLYYVCISLPV